MERLLEKLKWLGHDGVRIYHAGDTDRIPEMADITADIALLPVSGTYVMTAAEAVQAATGDSADDHLAYIQEYGIPVLTCTPCAAARQISEADLIAGARMATGAELINLSCESAVISL